jgi:anaerobic magnesium-protoporphyrin IX monomethyl ester cyclase
MEHICLIIPPSVFLLDERVTPSGGILTVAAVLERAGVHVEVLDLSGLLNFEKAVSDYCLRRLDVGIFGITSTTAQMPKVYDILTQIRKTRLDAKVILGGPHVTSINTACKGELKRGITDGRAIKALSLIHI